MRHLQSLLHALLQGAQVTPETPTTSSLPFSEADIKKALGIDPADPTVQIRIIPFPGLSAGMRDGLDLEVVLSAEDARSLDGDVTGAVTDAAFKTGFNALGLGPDPQPDPQPDPEAEAAEQEEIAAEVAGKQRWAEARLHAMNALDEVFVELKSAFTKHGSMTSAHEGHAVIREEFDEMWDEVKRKGGGYDLATRKEAVQVAAMAVRYLVDVNPG